MNTDPNINNTLPEDEPRLVPPQVVYERKDALKKKATVIPMFATVTAAAAAVALLFGLFWQRSSTPQLELTAELKPIVHKMLVHVDGKTTASEGNITTSDGLVIPNEAWQPQGVSAEAQQPSSGNAEAFSEPSVSPPKSPRSSASRKGGNTSVHHELPLLATMPQASTPRAVMPNQVLTDPQEVLLETTLAEEALAWTPQGMIRDEEAEWLAQQGLLEKSEVELVEFGEMLRRGWRSVKGEIAQLNESVGEGFRLLKQMPAPPSFHAND